MWLSQIAEGDQEGTIYECGFSYVRRGGKAILAKSVVGLIRLAPAN